MILFDIGANRGDATLAGLEMGYEKIIALEPAPKIFRNLVSNFIYTEQVIPLRFAVSDTNFDVVSFYEAEEDGLSTLNADWLTDETMPYNGKPYRTIDVTTVTVDWLVERFGKPDLIKIDVEGAEWSVFHGMSGYYGVVSFEWTNVTIVEHQKQLEYLQTLGYTEVGPQFIEEHLKTPENWFLLKEFDMETWVRENSSRWTSVDWKKSGLRPTADVGMLWVR